MKSLLLDGNFVAPWVSATVPVVRIVLFALVVLCAIVLIITTLFQDGDNTGSDIVTGQQESYYSQNKGGAKDAKLKLITIITSIVAVVSVILYFVFVAIPA